MTVEKEKTNEINICPELKYGGARPSFCKFQAKTAEILEKHVRFYHTRNFRKIIEKYKGVTALEDCVCGKAFINNSTRKSHLLQCRTKTKL